MENALPKLAAVTLCLSLSAGCVSRGEQGPAFPENYPTQAETLGSNNPAAGSSQFGNGPQKPSTWDGFVGAMTDNPVTRSFKSAGKSTANALTINPHEAPAYDPVSLNSRAPKPDAEMFVSLARVQESGGNLDTAAEMYQKALHIDKQYVPALVGLGQMRFRQQKHDEAFALFTQVRKLDPQNLEAILGQAHFHDTRENMPEATRLYTEATKNHPQVARTWNDLGLCLARQRRLAESQQTLQNAVRIDPTNVLYRNNLATVLVELKRPSEALAHLQQAHGQAAGHYNLGFLLHRRGEDQAAAEQFQYALRVDPSMEAAKLWLDKLNSGNNVPQRASTPPLGRSAALLRGPDGQSLNLYTKQEAFASRPPAPPVVDQLISEAPPEVFVEAIAKPAAKVSQVSAPTTPHKPEEHLLKQAAVTSEEADAELVIPVAVEISDLDETTAEAEAEIESHQDQQVQPAHEENTVEENEEVIEVSTKDQEAALDPPVPSGFELDLTNELQEPAKFTPVLIQPAIATGDAAQTIGPVADPILPAPQYPNLEKPQEQGNPLDSAPLPGEIATTNSEAAAEILPEAENLYED